MLEAKKTVLDVVVEEKSGEYSDEQSHENDIVEEKQIVEEPSAPMKTYINYMNRINEEKKSKKIAREIKLREQKEKIQNTVVDP